MPGKFKVGDRVRVVSVDEGDAVSIGDVGTVMEEDCAPWVKFDRCLGEPLCATPHTPDWCEGHMACLCTYQLELLQDRRSSVHDWAQLTIKRFKCAFGRAAGAEMTND